MNGLFTMHSFKVLIFESQEILFAKLSVAKLRCLEFVNLPYFYSVRLRILLFCSKLAFDLYNDRPQPVFHQIFLEILCYVYFLISFYIVKKFVIEFSFGDYESNVIWCFQSKNN